MSSSNTPLILLPQKFSQADVDKLKSKDGVKIVDIHNRQLAELSRVSAPLREHQKAGELGGAWIYLPWKNTLLHCVGPEELFALRTNRNQLLITKEEQAKLRSSIVGVAGMSVGAGIAKALVYSGMSSTIKIADFDKLDTTNLNRLQESLLSVGKPKAQLAAQHIYELDPYYKVDVYDSGLDETNIDKFFGKPALDVVIDEIDDFKMKVQLRLHAKKYQIPIIMFTSLGDNILVDVERYDTDHDLEIFNGLIGNVADEIMQKTEITQADIKRYSVQLIGAEYVPTQALASLLEINKTLMGRPQLYSTIAVDGGLCAYLVRQILLGADVKSGRHFIKFSELFSMADRDFSEPSKREDLLRQISG